MISADAISLIRHFEGCKLTAYKCPAGIWTIGYGTTRGVKEGDKITQEQADLMLMRDLEPLNKLIDLYISQPLKQNQRDALACLIYNIGTGNFATSSVCRKINQRDFAGAAAAFGLWNKVKVNGQLTVLPGLVSRRAAERALFESA